MIPVIKEPTDYWVQFFLYEKCYFCNEPTDLWHVRTNQPVCKDCHKTRKVSELKKCVSDYKPKTRKEYLKGNDNYDENGKYIGTCDFYELRGVNG